MLNIADNPVRDEAISPFPTDERVFKAAVTARDA
jgi:hypothetical protein